MEIERVWAVFFSATGTTRRVVTTIAETISGAIGIAPDVCDFTLPAARESTPAFSSADLVILGTPVYAGRVPNLLAPYLASMRGNGAPAVPVVLFGNRDYDDALIELRDILEDDGFHTVAAAAFVGEHAFSYTLAAGRPDEDDIAIARRFALQVCEKVRLLPPIEQLTPIVVKGVPKPYRPHYRPLDPEGNPLDFRRIRPRTSDACNDCKLCVQLCPMGAIDYANVKEYVGICIRCGACVKGCPLQARYYDDERYLRHQHELEEGLARRAQPELFL